MIDKLMDKENAAFAYYGVRIVMALMLVSGGSLGFGWVLGSSSMVNPGEKAVYVSGGNYQGTVGEGFHPGVPLVDRYRVFDMRQNVIRERNIRAVTKDDVNVRNLNITVRWNIKNGKTLGDVYKTVAVSQDKLREKVVRPAVKDAPRTCAAKFNISEVVKYKIEEYRGCIRDTLSEQLNKNGLTVKNIAIEDKDYPPNMQKQFRKQREAKEREKVAKAELNVTRQQSQQEVIEARSKAKSIQIIRANITDDYIRYERVKALGNATTVWVVPEGTNPSVSPEMTAGNRTAP